MRFDYWQVAAVCLLSCSSCASQNQQTPHASEPSDASTKQRSCKALIANYQSALERSFEVELNSLRSPDDLRRDWYKGLVALHVETRDARGSYAYPRDPTDVVQDVLANLSKLSDRDDRHRLEYVLLGSAMPLEARREFEKVCVEAAF